MLMAVLLFSRWVAGAFMKTNRIARPKDGRKNGSIASIGTVMTVPLGIIPRPLRNMKFMKGDLRYGGA